MKKKMSANEKKFWVIRYLNSGHTPTEISKLTGFTRQLVHYWLGRIKEDKDGRASS